jgi:hypothetical protein
LSYTSEKNESGNKRESKGKKKEDDKITAILDKFGGIRNNGS